MHPAVTLNHESINFQPEVTFSNTSTGLIELKPGTYVPV